MAGIAAAAVGGPSEILEHERTGILFPPRNAHSLSHALIRLVCDPGLRQRIGSHAAAEVRCKWLWTHSVAKMSAVYREIALSQPAMAA